jgi:hypothetical protein
MHIEALEQRRLMSADAHTVTVPIHDQVSGNLPDNFAEGTASHLGRFTAAFNAQGVFVFTVPCYRWKPWPFGGTDSAGIF